MKKNPLEPARCADKREANTQEKGGRATNPKCSRGTSKSQVSRQRCASMRDITRTASPTLRVSPCSSSGAAKQRRSTGTPNVKISMWLRETPKVGTARPASVGAVLGAKPELSFGLSWLPDAFDRVWVLALSGHLKFAHVHFHEAPLQLPPGREHIVFD